MNKQDFIEWVEDTFKDAKDMQGSKPPNECKTMKDLITGLEKVVIQVIRTTPVTELRPLMAKRQLPLLVAQVEIGQVADNVLHEAGLL